MRGELVSVVDDVEALVLDIELDSANARAPFQDRFNPIGSAQSGDPFGLDEAGDAQGELAFGSYVGRGGHAGREEECPER